MGLSWDIVLEQLLRPSVLFYRRPADGNRVEAGLSKFGGCPDLPSGFRWPRSGGVPLSFLLQLDCSALTAQGCNPSGIYPRRGMLYFFYDLSLMEWRVSGNRSSARVCYADVPPHRLRPRSYPEGWDEVRQVKDYPLSFQPVLSLPAADEVDEILCGQGLPAMESDAWDYRQAAFRCLQRHGFGHVRASDAAGRLGGYADVLQGSTLYTLSSPVSSALLLQLNSVEEEDYELLFSDCGSLYFRLPEAELQQADFRHLHVELQSY